MVAATGEVGRRTVYKAVLAAMEHWLDMGEKPGPQVLTGFDLVFRPPEWID